MRLFRLLLFFFFLVLMASRPTDKTSIAVYPIKAVGAVDRSVAATLTSILGYELTQSPKLIVIDETALKVVIERQAMNISDLCNDTVCQVEIGKLVQAQKMILAELSKLGARYILTTKVIDVEAGTLVFTDRQECVCLEGQLDQIVAGASIRIREHFGETGLAVKATYPQLPPASQIPAVNNPSTMPMPQGQRSFSVQEVVLLKQAGLSDDVIIAKISEGHTPMRLSIQEIVELKKVGISEKVIATMLAGGTKSNESISAPESPTMQEVIDLDPTGVLSLHVTGLVGKKASLIYLDGKYEGCIYDDKQTFQKQMNIGQHLVEVECGLNSFWGTACNLVQKTGKKSQTVDIKKGRENNYYMTCD